MMDMVALRIKLDMFKVNSALDKKAKSIKIMTLQDVKLADSRHRISVMCQATNMTGALCKSKATCGKYCKRHKI